MSIWNQAHCPKDFQHGHFGLDVLSLQALWDGVDALGVGQDMCAALGVVHQCLDAADDGGVDAALWRLVVHATQEVEEAGEAIKLNETCDKSRERKGAHTGQVAGSNLHPHLYVYSVWYNASPH